tara:strand:- start:25036 stop:25914 length:879 start_codon:yes stop_codon:yes gene_type:complete
MILARPHIKRKKYPIKVKNKHLLWEQFISKKYIIRAVQHYLNIMKLDEVRLKMLQSMKYDECPQDKNLSIAEKGDKSFVPYRTRIKTENIDTEVLSSRMTTAPFSDEQQAILDFQNETVSIKKIVEMIKKYYKKKNYNIPEQKSSQSLRQQGDVKISLHDGLLVDKLNVPCFTIIKKGNINIHVEKYDGWKILKTRNQFFFINCEGNFLPKGIEFSGKGDLQVAIFETWSYERYKFRCGLISRDDRWSKSSEVWSNTTQRWNERKLINYKKPKKVGVSDATEATKQNTKILY